LLLRLVSLLLLGLGLLLVERLERVEIVGIVLHGVQRDGR
jgi:hypothetical protein